MSRNIDDGSSSIIYISDDGVWEYSSDKDDILSMDEIKQKLKKFTS